MPTLAQSLSTQQIYLILHNSQTRQKRPAQSSKNLAWEVPRALRLAHLPPRVGKALASSMTGAEPSLPRPRPVGLQAIQCSFTHSGNLALRKHAFNVKPLQKLFAAQPTGFIAQTLEPKFRSLA